jgi:hypothetical protein
MTSEQFWASVFPAYLGAVGSIAASAVAVVAFVRELRTRKGLKEVADATSETVELPQPTQSLAPQSATQTWGEPLELVTHRGQTVIRNLTADSIEIVDIRVPSGGKHLTLRTEFPGVITPGEGFGFVVHDVLGGPAIAALFVEWRSVDGGSHLSKFFI